MSAFVTHPIPISDGSPFPIANIPFGIIKTPPSPRAATPVGNYILDLRALANDGHLETATGESLKDAWNKPVLNQFASLPRKVRSKVRKDIQSLIKNPESVLYNKERQHMYLHPLSEVKIHMPMKVEGFSDFMCSLEHITNVGLLKGVSRVPPNFFNLPLGYNGRASSVVVDGTSIKRPSGIINSEGGRVDYRPCENVDFEMEMGFVSQPLDMGETVPASRAHEHIFGFVILNDWSARDIQFHESMPLGPFNGKAFGTSVEENELVKVGSGDRIMESLLKYR